jgi:hypothetical protein
MVRRRPCAVSNPEAPVRLILRDAAKTPLLRMRTAEASSTFADTSRNGDAFTARHHPHRILNAG